MMKIKTIKKAVITAILVALVMTLGLASLAFANPTWTDVDNFTQLGAALADAKITHIRMTSNIHVERNGADINENKTALVIDGAGYTITAHSSNSRSETLRLSKAGKLNDITLINANIQVRNYFGLISVAESKKMEGILLTFENIEFHGPQLVFAEDCYVTLRNGIFNVVPGHNGTVDELVEAKHIRLEGNIDIYKDAHGRDELFRIDRANGGITIGKNAVVNVSLNRDQRKAHRSGFIHMQKSGGYIRFEEDSFFSFDGNGFFQQHMDVREVTIGERAQVYINTHGNFKGNYGVFMLRGEMVVEEGAIVRLIALGNTKKAPMIQLDKKISTVTFNSPEELFIYNSSTHKKDRGSAIGLEGSADRFDIIYNGIKSLGYWEENIMPPDNLGAPTYGWENSDSSAYSVSYGMDKRTVTNIKTVNYSGATPFTVNNTHLFDVNVIYIGGPAGTHLIEFDANGGTPEPTPQNLKDGDLIEMPIEPEKEGYNFGGWYADPDFGGEPWDFENDIPSEDVTLTAKWSIKDYKISFDANGGTPEPNRQTIEHGNLVEKPTDPILEHMKLIGWYSDPGFTGQPWDFENDRVTEDVSLYAKWDWAHRATVTYSPGLEGAGGIVVSNIGVGDKYVILNGSAAGLYNEGFVVVSWVAGNGDEYEIGQEITLEGHMILFAVWAEARGRSAPQKIQSTGEDIDLGLIDEDAYIKEEEDVTAGDSPDDDDDSEYDVDDIADEAESES